MKLFWFLILSFLLIAFSHFVFRAVVRKSYARIHKLSLFTTLLQSLLFALHANLSYTFLPTTWPTLPPLPSSVFHSTVGMSILGIGLITTIWTMSGLGFRKTIGQRAGGLHSSGIYRYSRNPQLICYGLALIGVAALWPSFYGLSWLLIYAVIVHMMVRTEEEHLKDIFGSEYEQYCEEVPRYVAFSKI
jgi:protein-S-isoprenylcysteine O-methyltransferase Ste14